MTPSETNVSVPEPISAQEIDGLSESYLDAELALSPNSATFIGVPTYDEDLTDYSPAGYAARHELLTRTEREAEACEVDGAAGEVARAALLERVSLDREMHDAHVPQTQLNAISSSPVSLRQVFDLMPTADDADWQVVATRLAKVPEALVGLRATLGQEAAEGHSAARRQVLNLAARVGSWTGDGSSSGSDFFSTFAAGATDVAAAGTAERVRAAAESARQAYVEFGDWLRRDLAPIARERDACGREEYELSSRYFLGARVDLDETYAWGFAELERIETEMGDIAADLNGGDRDIRATADILDAAPDRQIRGKENFRRWMQELADTALADLHGTHFDIPESIRRIECCIAPTSDGSIYYTGPSEDTTTRPGRMWWAVPDGVDEFATWREVTTVYHEGVPGHHLQIAQTILQRDLNRWRRLACWVSGHGEGWALYAERLMGDLGYLDDPGVRFGMLDGQAFRAARVIIDIGMHLELEIPRDNPFGFHPGETWTPELGLEFLLAHSRMEREFLVAELERYLGWPGQAPAYKVGERIWLQARDDARRRQGDAFDLREFHRSALALGSLGLDPFRDALARM